jgi:hypothetical protein
VCWKPCSSCWSFHLLREEFLSAPIHSPLSGSPYRSFSGLRCARAGATTVGFYSRYARAVADSLHVEATDALRRSTAGLGVRPRRAERRRRGERAHAAWHAGSPAEMRPGGACGADAHRAHAQTPRAGRGTAVHGVGASATCGVAPGRALGPVRAVCPCLLAQFSKIYM